MTSNQHTNWSNLEHRNEECIILLGRIYIYKVCPFGASFSAHWWGRLGGFFLRMMHRTAYLAHSGRLYVDDFYSQILPITVQQHCGSLCWPWLPVTIGGISDHNMGIFTNGRGLTWGKQGDKPAMTVNGKRIPPIIRIVIWKMDSYCFNHISILS